MKITVDSKCLLEQLRYDLMLVHNFDEYIRIAAEELVRMGFGNGEQILERIRLNQHFRELHRARIVAVLELLGKFNETIGDTSDTENLERIINALEQNVI